VTAILEELDATRRRVLGELASAQDFDAVRLRAWPSGSSA